MQLYSFVNAIKRTIFILSSPKQALVDLEKEPLESTVGYYIRMLLLVAIIAGIFNLFFSLLRALYLDIFITIDIQYSRMINYALGASSSILFLFLFAGTFILFFISVIVKPFIRRLKYAELLKVLMFSMAPILLFGWIPITILPFTIWSIFLFVLGVRTYKTEHIKKDSIRNRE